MHSVAVLWLWISAAINHRFNNYHGIHSGFFGFFEVIEGYEVARTLLDHARAWAKGRGMAVLRGPGEYSTATYERQGILVDGFQYAPAMELTHNPPYYGTFLKQYGFHKAKDYSAYTFDVPTPIPLRLTRLVEQVRLRREIVTRPLNLKESLSEVRLIAKIYNDSWSENWGVLPITEEEADSLADSLRMIVDPGIIHFAFMKGEPAAVLGAFPAPIMPYGHGGAGTVTLTWCVRPDYS